MNHIDAFRTVPATTATPQLDFVLLDGSGSMRDSWWPMLDAIETYIATLKTQRIASRVILDIFTGDRSLEVYRARDTTLDAWVSTRTDAPGSTWGGTPLYDAISHAVHELRDLDPTKCHLTIVTDGDEADSKYTDQTQAKGLLDWCRAKGWQVSFIGCDFDNSRITALLGGERSAIGVAKGRLSDAMKALADKRVRYGLYGEAMHWSDQERTKFGGYLAGPSS